MQLPEPYPSLVNHLAHPTPRGRFQLLSFKHFAYPPPRSKVQFLPFNPSFSSFSQEQDLVALFQTILLILILGVGFICSLLTHLAHDPSPRSRFQLLSFKPSFSSFSQEQDLVRNFSFQRFSLKNTSSIIHKKSLKIRRRPRPRSSLVTKF